MRVPVGMRRGRLCSLEVQSQSLRGGGRLGYLVCCLGGVSRSGGMWVEDHAAEALGCQREGGSSEGSSRYHYRPVAASQYVHPRAIPLPGEM